MYSYVYILFYKMSLPVVSVFNRLGYERIYCISKNKHLELQV